MAELINRLSWSNSRQNAYRRCLREYYWRAFGSWGGWDRGKASPESSLAYLCTKMKSLPMLIGELIHHEIERVFDAHRRRRPVPTPADAEKRFVERLRQSWEETAAHRWQESPKKYPPLAEVYFGTKPTRQAAGEMRDAALQCLRNFRGLDLTARILESPPQSIRSLEKLEEIPIAGGIAHIKVDLAWQQGDALHLIDWKTGAASPRERTGAEEEVADQLAAYAFFARRQWGVEYENMTGYPVYLRGPSIGENCLSAERIERLENDIEFYFSEIRKRLATEEPPSAAAESFPMTSDLWKCSACFFRQLCER